MNRRARWKVNYTQLERSLSHISSTCKRTGNKGPPIDGHKIKPLLRISINVTHSLTIPAFPRSFLTDYHVSFASRGPQNSNTFIAGLDRRSNCPMNGKGLRFLTRVGHLRPLLPENLQPSSQAPDIATASCCGREENAVCVPLHEVS